MRLVERREYGRLQILPARGDQPTAWHYSTGRRSSDSVRDGDKRSHKPEAQAKGAPLRLRLRFRLVQTSSPTSLEFETSSPQVGRGLLGHGQVCLIDVAPGPALAGLERGHDRMLGLVEVFRGVASR